jgi:hypothetical protein
MPIPANPMGRSRRVRPLHVVVCILLAGFLLYNPFFSLIHSQVEAALQHPASNRATVGAAELDHFPPVTKQLSAALPAAELISPRLLRIAEENTLASPKTFDSPHFPKPQFSSHLWFRPPPSV